MPSRAVLTEAQTIPNADIVQALGNLKITATSGITTTLPTTSSTLAGLSVANTFTAAQSFSSTISLVTTTSTTGQILQASKRLLHTYGTSNIFLGSEAGNFTTTGLGKNIAIGRITLQSLTGGIGNIVIGDACGFSITSGSSNMLFGEFSGNLITSGTQNCALGVSSLRGVTTTSDNTAIGFQALYSTTGSKNTGIGVNSSWTCTSGSKNTFIGEYSGASTDLIGGLTGIGITTGSNNTMLGQNTASTTAAGNYRTAIGSDSRCQSNNAIKLGRDYSASNAGDITILAQIPTANLPAASADNKGAIVYNTTDNVLYFSNGTSWAAV
jgi:hypothetical protein